MISSSQVLDCCVVCIRMGRVKLKIKKLENTNGRQATFAKRKNGILKKANELSILCDIDLILLMFSPAGKASLCCGHRRLCFFFSRTWSSCRVCFVVWLWVFFFVFSFSSIEEVIAKFSQVTPEERTKKFVYFIFLLIDMFTCFSTHCFFFFFVKTGRSRVLK